jgi:hypothetical protein
MAAASSSFDQAEVSLQVVGELSISDRQINKLATEMGIQMAAQRDQQTDEWVEQDLPRQKTAAETPVDLAAVFTDGGRMRTREAGGGRGVHNAHWRETKNAAFHRMTSDSFQVDPEPDLPSCFRNEAYVAKLVQGLKNLQKQGREEDSDGDCPSTSQQAVAEITSPRVLKTVHRTCLSSLVSSDAFGPMMAAAADARGFFRAAKKAFVADGQAYNWTIQRQWFSDFTPIVDFVHVVEYLYEAAKAVHSDREPRWRQYVTWVTACWQGHVDEVVKQLEQWQSRLGPLPEDEEVSETDARKVLASTITYLSNNRNRMHYPGYRREGLPVTSSLAESLVKQISKRVKGTEMFWDDGPSAEAILQLRAALISDGVPISRWIATRPISPFSPRCRSTPLAIAS